MYFINNKAQKPKFDYLIEGTLTDSDNRLVPCIFGGKPIKRNIKLPLQITAIEEGTQLGKVRDKIYVRAHFTCPLFVASKKLQTLLMQVCTNQVALYDLEIKTPWDHFTDFKVVNILNTIDCIDDEKSHVVYYSEEEENPDYRFIYSAETLTLDSTKIPPDINIFMLDRVKSSIIVVSEKFKNEIEDRGISGFLFFAPDQCLV